MKIINIKIHTQLDGQRLPEMRRMLRVDDGFAVSGLSEVVVDDRIPADCERVYEVFGSDIRPLGQDVCLVGLPRVIVKITATTKPG